MNFNGLIPLMPVVYAKLDDCINLFTLLKVQPTHMLKVVTRPNVVCHHQRMCHWYIIRLTWHQYHPTCMVLVHHPPKFLNELSTGINLSVIAASVTEIHDLVTPRLKVHGGLMYSFFQKRRCTRNLTRVCNE